MTDTVQQPLFPRRRICANLSAPEHFSLPVKGRVGEGWGGLGRVGEGMWVNSAASDPIPLLASPLKGEELGKLAHMRLCGNDEVTDFFTALLVLNIVIKYVSLNNLPG